MFFYPVLLDKSNSALLQAFSQVSGAWDSSEQNLPVKIKVKKALREPHRFPCVLSAGPLCHFCNRPTFPCRIICRHPFCGRSDPSSGPTSGELWLSHPCLCTPRQCLHIHLRSPAPASMPHTSFELSQDLILYPGFLPPFQGIKGSKGAVCLADSTISEQQHVAIFCLKQ